MQTITQECALLALEYDTHIPNSQQRNAGAILDENMGECIEYLHLVKHPKYKDTWSHSYRNEIGWLAQGMPWRVKEINTIFFINRVDVPPDRHKDITYGCIVCDYQKGKHELNRTRLTMGGD